MVRIKQVSNGVEKGQQIGSWKVLGHPFSIGVTKMYVVVRCDCGEVSVVRCGSLKYGGSSKCASCGSREGATRHGDAADGRVSRLYEIYWGMKKRCYGEYHPHYHNYGGRGISVCKEWLGSYEAFREWALANGYADGLELDRRENDGNYEPGNCRWITRKRNSRNKRTNRLVTAFEVTKCLVEWAEDARCVVSKCTLTKRLNEGWNPESAILLPAKRIRIKQTCVSL